MALKGVRMLVLYAGNIFWKKLYETAMLNQFGCHIDAAE